MLTLPRLRASSDELLHLDFLRFIASIGIVYHHSHEFFVPLARRAQDISHTAGMALFVDLFFVISGFVIAYVYKDRVRTWRDFGAFMQRRIGRIMPLHWLVLSLYIAVWTVFIMTGHAGNHPPSTHPLCIASTAFLLNAYITCGNGITFNVMTWTLSVEMGLYIMFPIFAWIALRNAKAAIVLSALCLIAAVGLASYSHVAWADSVFILRGLPSFILGVALFHNRETLKKMAVPPYLFAGVLIVLVASMLFGAPQLLTLALVYLLAVCAVASDLRGATPAWVRKLAPLGQLTYSIYLWHGLFVFVFINAIADKGLHGNLAALIGCSVICYLGTAVTSYVSFFWIETPARRYIDSLKFGSASKTAA